MLQISHLCASIEKHPILHDISFSLEGQICGLLGPNGVGKTTLLRCIVGALNPKSGIIEKPKKIGYLPQHFGAYKSLSVYETLSYYATLKEIPDKECKEAIAASMKATNLEQEARKKNGSLSGGMLRRLGIAQAILGTPELVLFDEPTTGLDPEERMRFKLLLLDLKQQGISVVISTHIVEDVEMVCDKIIIMDKGEIVSDGSPEKTAALAKNKTFLVRADKAALLQKPFYPVRGEWHDRKQWIRFVSSVRQGDTEAEPDLEDGYICAVHGLS